MTTIYPRGARDFPSGYVPLNELLAFHEHWPTAGETDQGRIADVALILRAGIESAKSAFGIVRLERLTEGEYIQEAYPLKQDCSTCRDARSALRSAAVCALSAAVMRATQDNRGPGGDEELDRRLEDMSRHQNIGRELYARPPRRARRRMIMTEKETERLSTRKPVEVRGGSGNSRLIGGLVAVSSPTSRPLTGRRGARPVCPSHRELRPCRRPPPRCRARRR